MEKIQSDPEQMRNGHRHDKISVIKESDYEKVDEFYERLSENSHKEREIGLKGWKTNQPPLDSDIYAYWADQFEESDEYELTAIRSYRPEQRSEMETQASNLFYGITGNRAHLTKPVYIIESKNRDGETQMIVKGDEYSRERVEQIAGAD